MKKTNTKKGFTIIELVIVIAVIGILAAVLIPTFSNVIDKANLTKDMEEAKNAYTNFLVSVENIDVASYNFCIKSGDHYFHVVNGQFNAKAATVDDPTFGTGTGTGTETGTTVTPKLYKVEKGALVEVTGGTHTHN